ncbi:putative coenzyme Q-binding protein COQ10, START [Helianthus annuus]|nr:putative coenzyme Q-binding protein COQ10, START [Helianthus annuus]
MNLQLLDQLRIIGADRFCSLDIVVSLLLTTVDSNHILIHGILIISARIPCARPGRIWLEQRGLQRALYWHIEARVVLDLQEFPNSANGRELHFSMVDGDFKKFEGKWSVKSGKR